MSLIINVTKHSTHHRVVLGVAPNISLVTHLTQQAQNKSLATYHIVGKFDREFNFCDLEVWLSGLKLPN